MARLKLCFLGSPQLEVDGTGMECGSKKALALLAYLAVTGQSHSRDALSTLLWPDSGQRRARSYLRHALWWLKTALGDGWLEISREQVGLNPEADIWLDVTIFQQGVAAGSADDAESLSRLVGAVELYHDDFLTGFTVPDAPEFDEWQFFQTEGLREKLAGALERLVWGYSQQGEYEAAIPYGRRWVALDPLHEPAQRHLMQLYGKDGQKAAALRQYEEYATLLEKELNLPPEAETTALYEAIKARRIVEPFLKPQTVQSEQTNKPDGKSFTRTPTQAQGVSLGKTKLVGRRAELETINQALAEVKRGKGSLLLLGGEAGVGKTRLAHEALGQSGLRLLRSSAGETANAAYSLLVSVLRTYRRTRPIGLARIGPLAKYLAFLMPELGKAPADSDQATLFEALRCAFEQIAADEPTVVLFDDLQWADNTTLEFLLALAGRLNDVPLLIVGTYRSDEIDRNHPLRRLRTELRRARLLSEIMLTPLSPAETTTLISRMCAKPISPALASVLYDRTQGIPLFVEELTAVIKELGHLKPGPNGLELDPQTDLPIPETIRDTVLLRLDGLSEKARQLLEAAAVAGLNFDLDFVLQLDESDAGLKELFSQAFITETGSGQAAFRHALTREAIYNEIIWTRRRSLHRQIAARLAAEGAPPEIVAEHWLMGRELDQARQALVQASRRSCQIHAYRDAAAAAQRALEIWPEGQDETERLDVLHQLGNCAQLSGMLADAARAWREVAAGRQAMGDDVQFAEVQRRLANVYQLQGAWSQYITARQAAAEAFVECGLPGEAATERLAAAAHMQGAGSFSASLPLIESARREAEQSERIDLIARSMGLKGLVTGKLGQIEAGLQEAQAGLSLALEHNLTGPASEIYWRYASIMEQAADYNQAREVYLTAIDYCHTHGASLMENACMACVAGVFWHTGEWERMVSICREVMASVEPASYIHAVAAAYLGSVYIYRGQPKPARKILTESIAQARHHNVIGLEFIGVWPLAMTDAFEEKVEATIAHCRYMLEIWRKSEERHYIVPALRWAATFFAGQNAEEDVRACAQVLAEIATATGNSEALAGLAHALGEAALLNGEAGQASEQFNQALKLLQTIESPIQRAETQFRAGVAAVAAGDRDTGHRHLVEAQHQAQTLGALPLANQVAQALTILGK